MKRSWLFVFLFVVGLAVFTVVTMPLSYVLEKSGAARLGLVWSHAEGTPLKARLYGLQYGPQPIGNLDLVFAPSQLLKGKLGYKFSIIGHAGSGEGVLALTRNTVTVSDFDAEFNLANWIYLEPDVRQTEGRASVSNGALQFKDGGCQSAKGAISSDLLLKFADRFNLTASALNGTLQCAGDALQIDMAGTVGREDKLTTQLIADLRDEANFEAHLKTSDPLLILGLTDYGFTEVEDGVTYLKAFSLQQR